MSEGKRVQGRPIRGVGDVGREKLVEAARSLLQVKVPQTLSRKAVADAAGVTPALVSYYFPDKAALVSAATRPLITQRIADLDAVLASTGSYHVRLRGVVSWLVRLYATEAHLIDLTLDALRRNAADPLQRSMLLAAYGDLQQFVREGAAAGAWRPLETDDVLCALFGMCRSLATIDGAEDIRAETARIDLIVDFALHGLMPAPPGARIEGSKQDDVPS